MSSTFSNTNEIAEAILKERYLEDTPYLSDEELKDILKIIIEKSNKDDWRLVQHQNDESDHTWFELDLSDGCGKSFYETLEWLNYTR